MRRGNVRKYWKLMTLAIFVLVVFSGFYINYTTISERYPEFSFHKLEGEEKVIEPVIVNGDYYKGMFSPEPFRVQQTGTTYLRDESFMDRLSGYYRPFDIERLQKEYRTFMRGKEEEPKNFFENDEILAYGAIPYDMWSFENYHFEISLLDKQSNKTTSFTAPIPNRGDYWHIEPYQVRVVDETLSIITMNEKIDYKDGSESTEVHMYTFDWQAEQLVEEEVIAQFPSTIVKDGYEQVELLFNETSSDHIIITQNKFVIESTNNSDEYTERHSDSKIIQYNMQTNEVDEIKESAEELGQPFAFTSNQL